MGVTVQFERDTKASGPEWTSYIDQYIVYIYSCPDSIQMT